MTNPRPTLANHEGRIAVAEQRLDEHEARLASYDKILVKLDTLIDVLTEQTKTTAKRVEDAIEGQGVLKERNDGTHRWATLAWTVATGVIVGAVGLLIGHAMPK